MPLSPLDEFEPRRVCLVKPSALGDIVQTLPLLGAFRARWPNAHVAWVVNRSLAGLLRGHPDLNEVIEFDRGARGWGRLRATWSLLRRLRRGGFDLAVDVQGLFRSGLMTWATRAARRVGFANAREGAAAAYTDRVAVPPVEMSAVDRYWLLARALGARGEPPAPRLGLTPVLREWAARQVAALPRPLLAIHPGAAWETKRWPPGHFAELARRAKREFGAGIVLVGGPGEGRLAEEIAAAISGAAVNLAEKTSLLELAAVSAEADAFLSGDTGPMHLAAAVGTPVTAVFTCTSPVRARPYGEGHAVVATAVSCAASYLKKCPTRHCFAELTPDRVWPTLRRTLAGVAPMTTKHAS